MGHKYSQTSAAVCVTFSLFPLAFSLGYGVQERIFDHLLKPEKYSKRDLPRVPTRVRVSLYINEIPYIREADMEFQVNFYFRQEWNDSRLQFNESIIKSWDDPVLSPLAPEGVPKRLTAIPDDIKTRLFLPDTMFKNGENAASYLDGIGQQNTVYTIQRTGEVFFSRHLITKFSCPMRLQKFPFDTQTCSVRMESFGHRTDYMDYVWHHNALGIDKNLYLLQFSLTGASSRAYSRNYTFGAYPCLQLDLYFRRNRGRYFFQIFLPSTIMVILSWSVFWTDMDCGSKVSLEVVFILTITAMTLGVSQTLPPVSYVKSLDVWCFSCLSMCCAALTECVLVNYLHPEQTQKQTQPGKPAQEQDHVTRDAHAEFLPKHEAVRPVKSPKRTKAEFIDVISRVLFPVAFIVFNCFFWIQHSL